jgi:TPR repeat protein
MSFRSLLSILLLAALTTACPNAEEEKKKKAAKQAAFMEAEAQARAAEEKKQREEALTAATAKCATDAAGCIDLGKLWVDGETKDAAKALAAFDDACGKKSKEGCMLAGQNVKEPKDALERWRKGCDLGDAEQCVAAVAALDAIAQKGGSVDEGTQVALLERACGLGVGRTCTALGLLAKEKDPKKAQAQFERGCKAKEPTACVQIADLYKTGKVGKKKEADRKVAEYLKKACDLGLADVCTK